MLKITLAVAVALGAASAAHATCTLVGGPLAGATLTATKSNGLITGTFTSPLGNVFPAGGFTVGGAWEVMSIDQDLGTDYNVVIILRGGLTTYRAWGENSPLPAFHRMTPNALTGTVLGASGGQC
jgi:hypothetical protein